MACERVKPTYVCIYFTGYLFDEGPRRSHSLFFGGYLRPFWSLIGEYKISSGSHCFCLQGANRLYVTLRKTEITFKNELYRCLWMTARSTDREQHVMVPKILVAALID